MRLLILVLASLPILFLLTVLLFVGWRWQLKRDVDRQLATLEARGIPLSGAELNEFYTAVPADQNAALVMTQAFALMQNFSDERDGELRNWKLPARSESMGSNEVQLLADFLALNEAARTRTRKAIQLPTSRYPVDFTPGFDTLLPHLTKVKSLARCESYSAALQVENRDLEKASDDIRVMLALAATLDEEPCLLSQLVNMAILRMAQSTLEHVLNSGSLEAVTLLDLTEAFDAAARTNRMHLGFTGEIGMVNPIFRMNWVEIERLTSGDESDPFLSAGVAGFLRLTGLFDRDQRHYLASMESYLDMAERPPPGNLEILGLEDEILGTARRRYFILSSMLLPALTKVAVKEAEATACVTLARVALRVEQFRLEHNRIPTRLFELLPDYLAAVPIDPFDGQPLRYHPLDRGYQLYSIGRDQQSDGGKEPPRERTSGDTNTYDLTFIVER